MKIINEIPLAYLPNEDGERTFKITKDIKVTLSDRREVIIPEGFITDLSSIPKWLWSFLQPMDKALIADIVHDFLWKNQNEEIEILGGSYIARKYADDQRLSMRMELAPDKKIKNYVTHYTIRLIGGFFYSRQIKIPN